MYGTSTVCKYTCKVFDFLPISALIDGSVLCIHGGLSTKINTLDQIRMINHRQERPHDGAFYDLLWSDAADIPIWGMSPLGAGWLFGDNPNMVLNRTNNMGLIFSGHQLVRQGNKYIFDHKIVTVWPAPNIGYRCGNLFAIMTFDDKLARDFKVFEEEGREDEEPTLPNLLSYFQ